MLTDHVLKASSLISNAMHSVTTGTCEDASSGGATFQGVMLSKNKSVNDNSKINVNSAFCFDPIGSSVTDKYEPFEILVYEPGTNLSLIMTETSLKKKFMLLYMSIDEVG
jgi:hypothetical protein